MHENDSVIIMSHFTDYGNVILIQFETVVIRYIHLFDNQNSDFGNLG